MISTLSQTVGAIVYLNEIEVPESQRNRTCVNMVMGKELRIGNHGDLSIRGRGTLCTMGQYLILRLRQPKIKNRTMWQ